MSANTIIGLTIGLVVILGAFYFLNKKGKIGSSVETINHPPFTIKKKNSYGSRYDLNTASRRDDSRSYYSIYYKEELITFPPELSENTGVSGLWKAYILKDAPRPALLAGSKYVYLITEEDDTWKITSLSAKNSDFISTQWLDSENGQPAKEESLYSSNDTGADCQFSDGQFLLISGRMVLDISDLSLYPVQFSGDIWNNYSFGQVIGFSPDKDKIVYMGSSRGVRGNHVLLTWNFKINEGRAIHFDRTETRLQEIYDPNPAWLPTYFDWVAKEESNLVLEKREFETLPNWEGRFSGELAYCVSPVKIEMMPIFVAFAKDFLSLSDEEVKLKAYGSSDTYDIKVGVARIQVSYQDGSGTVYVSDDLLDEDEEACKAIIKKVGEAFNELLKNGEHQSLFTDFSNTDY